jgi:predicted RND superfamily exporter protein
VSQAPRSRGLALLADFLVRYRIGLLVGAAVISAFAFVEASKLTLEHSIESLYALDDPHLLDYRQSKSLFGGDEFVIVV